MEPIRRIAYCRSESIGAEPSWNPCRAPSSLEGPGRPTRPMTWSEGGSMQVTRSATPCSNGDFAALNLVGRVRRSATNCVALAADCNDHRPRTRCTPQLGPQTADVHVNQVACAQVLVAPNQLANHRAREHLVGTTSQRNQQAILGRCQLHELAVQDDGAPRLRNDELVDPDLIRGHRRHLAHPRSA